MVTLPGNKPGLSTMSICAGSPSLKWTCSICWVRNFLVSTILSGVDSATDGQAFTRLGLRASPFSACAGSRCA